MNRSKLSYVGKSETAFKFQVAKTNYQL